MTHENAPWDKAEAVTAAIEESEFSGVVAVDKGTDRLFEAAAGLASRAYGVANTMDTRFGVASVSKGFTALVVMKLVEEGKLSLDRSVREILGDDLPALSDSVTVRHLLSHRAGISDYIDESDDWEPDDFVLPVPTHTLTTAESYLPALASVEQTDEPGETDFSYSNAGFIILAIVIERVTGETFTDTVRRYVLQPAGLNDTDYFQLNALPERTATGYLFDEGDQTNALHLPIQGNGDGGAFTTVDDLRDFWLALFDDKIVSAASREELLNPVSDVENEDLRYALGFWLESDGPGVILEGSDSGVSIRTTHYPDTRTTVTVVSNTSEGAWPVGVETL